MGLFGERDKCPVCGEPVPRLMARKIEGQAICKKCDKKMSMEEEMTVNLTLEDFKKHLAYREENARLHETFHATREVEFLWGKKLCIDDDQKLFYIDQDDENPPIFKFKELKAFRYVEKLNIKTNIVEGKNKYRRAVINFSREEKKRRPSYTGLLEAKLVGMTRWENLADAIFNVDDEMVELKKPIKYFRLVFVLKNPYWKKMKLYYLDPKLDQSNPDNMNYAIRQYLKQCDVILQDAEKMAAVMSTILDDND